MFYILSIITCIFWSVSFALVEDYQYRNYYTTTDQVHQRLYNSLWHKLQVAQRFFGNALGFIIGCWFISNGMTIYRLLTIYFLLITVHWIISDLIQNLMKNRPPFFVSSQSTAITEKFSMWWVKLIVFSVSVAMQFL